MPFSHHSHSGQFCPGHAKNQLEEVIQAAIAKKMQVFCLTEHMPRGREDFYPEEVGDDCFLHSGPASHVLATFFFSCVWIVFTCMSPGQFEAGDTETSHLQNEAAYFAEAVRLREKYADRIKILIGFEIDWIRPESLALIERSLTTYPFDFFVGSVHHAHTVPIDYDREMYVKARQMAGGTDERLYEDYFDAQFDMLSKLRPLVVGHFDLIRLKSDDPERSFTEWPGVWERALRNLEFIARYGGMLELNSAALRKGMSEPYPKAEICKVWNDVHLPKNLGWTVLTDSHHLQEFLARGGRFCLSDDSHGVDQVGLNFHRVLSFMDDVGISTLHYLRRDENPEPASMTDWRFPRTQICSIPVSEVRKLPFFG